ncbi:MAG: DNA polymerase domain-containing protein [Candidatus Thermoplasmatota archaeon]|nr:DNA polymerase domain-containing protein [Candidatus Thermoplasmatota archaeon]
MKEQNILIFMNYEMRILASSYEKSNEEAIIELYGKTKENRSIVARYYGFKPYFFAVEPSEEVLQELKSDENVLKLEKEELFYEGSSKECAKISIKAPWQVPEYRNKFRKYFNVLAADIPFTHRFIYDFDLASCVRLHCEDESEEVKKKYTTELVVKAQKFENIPDFKPALKILSFDLENSIKTGELYVICCVVRAGDKVTRAKIVGKEEEIIKKFIELVKVEDPDVITGYNIEGYDFPVLEERANAYGIALSIARDGTALRSTRGRAWRAHGRLLVDVWLAAKRELHPKKETLAHIAKLVLNKEKLGIDPTKIDEEWERNREKVIDYCMNDAELALGILEKIGSLEKAMDLATVSKLPVEDALAGRTSLLIDSILIREADRHKVGVPCMKHGEEREGIIGGYVHSIQPGLYHWVCLADFRSMYPSIIIANNICFTTLNPKGGIVSPTNVRFLSKEEKEGLLPGILERLLKERAEIKKKLKGSKDSEQIRYYQGLELAVKTLMNAFYGVFASSFYRFTNPAIGGSITAFARESIKKIIKTLESEGVNVIYADTDSIFFQSPYDSLEETVKFGEKTAERFSKGGVVLESEKVLEPFFSHGKKKRYVGKVVWPKKELLVRGYEVRRTDAFDLQTEALAKVFDEILKCDPESATQYAREIISKVVGGEVEVEKLAISKTVRGEEDYKAPESQAGVQASRKLKELGYEFVPGMKVSWIVTNGKASPQRVEPYIDGREFKHKPDYEYYAQRIAQSLARITEVFGWDENSLLSGIKQKTLFEEERKKKGAKLEDFF